LTPKEADLALNAAIRAYNQGKGRWAMMSVFERIAHVEQFVEQMKKKRAEVVKILMWEIGKTLGDSEKEFDRTVEYILDTIKTLKDMDRRASQFTIEQGIIAQIRRVPFGVTLCMGPYNYPLNETFTTLIPALIMGNTVIFKPAKYGVLLHRPLLEAFKDCFPKGVMNIIYGSGRVLAGAIMETGKVDAFAFIGTSNSASDIKKMHPRPHRLRAVLGLDAKNPAIILPDADLELTVKECVTGSLSYNGQRCTALKILFVHSSIAEKFLTMFSAEVNKLKIGMPWEKGVQITPLPEPEKTAYLTDLINDAIQKGARVINEGGGTVVKNFFKPAVVYPVNSTMKLYHVEQFGPIVPILSFDDIQTPLHYVVESSYGQQASIFGNNSEEMGYLIDQLVNQVSRINVNTQCQRGPDVFPFNGRKDSAEGTLSVADALRVFSIRTFVAAKGTEENKKLIKEILSERDSKFLTTDYIF
ncbi:MAG: NADP-dependent glyceraldehyde-3-phosphate dehydrogenase, partial [Bacteroidetes bacterium]